jgi:hypothetical protein
MHGLTYYFLFALNYHHNPVFLTLSERRSAKLNAMPIALFLKESVSAEAVSRWTRQARSMIIIIIILQQQQGNG